MVCRPRIFEKLSTTCQLLLNCAVMLKFGADFRYYQVNARNFSSGNGLFQFDGSETGNDFADFLLGAPSYFEQSSLQLLDSRTRYFGIFAQDTFKIRPNVTLNYGLRSELSQPFYD